MASTSDRHGKRRLLICLLGGRPDPVVLTALWAEPDEVAIVCSEDRHKEGWELMRTLQRALPRAFCREPVSIAPYVLTEARTVITQLIRNNDHHEVILSLTSASMPMAIGAYEAARRCGIPAFYTSGNLMYNLASAEPATAVKIQMDIDEFLQCHGLARDDRHDADAMGGGGHWLEREVVEAARQQKAPGQEAEAPLFYDCAHSVKFKLGVADREDNTRIRAAEREIDFLGVRYGVGIIASCKTGNRAFEKEHLDVLATIADKLGARYCTRLYIVGEPRPSAPPRHADPFTQFLQQADSAGIVVVTRGKNGYNVQRLPEQGQQPLPEAEPIGDILKRETLTPTYSRR